MLSLELLFLQQTRSTTTTLAMLKHNTAEIGMQRPTALIQCEWDNSLLSFNQRYRPVLTAYSTVVDCGPQVPRSKGVPVNANLNISPAHIIASR